MTARKIAFVLLAIVALALVISIPSCHDGGNVPDIASENFPEKTKDRIELPPQAGEEIRYVYFTEDGLTRTLTQIEYRSGQTSYIFYRADGTQKEMRSLYPLKEGATKRALQSIVIFEDDGVSYKSHQVYREDGSMARSGGRLSDGSYQTLYFTAETGSVERRLQFTAERELTFEERFDAEGKLVEKSEQTSAGALKTTRYGDDGKVVSEITDYASGSRDGKLFYEDGTVKVEFDKNDYRVQVSYFDPAGTLLYEVEYTAEGMEVVVFGPGDKPLYKQEWKHISGTTLCDAQFQLVKVEEYHKWGDYKWSKELKRFVEFADDGVTPTKVTTPLAQYYSSQRIEQELHPDGSVAVEKEFNSSNQEVRSTTYKPGEKKLDLDANRFKKPPFECLDVPDSKIKQELEPGDEGQIED